MPRDASDRLHARLILPLEHELSMHLERAHVLGERAQRSNDSAQQQIERARAIAEELSHVKSPERGSR
jgi:hypothetical protein